MAHLSLFNMQRIKTPTVEIGSVKIGGGSPVAIQSMTNTDTADWKSTAQQCVELANAGSELVRFTVNNEDSAAAVPLIKKELIKQGFGKLPLVGDFHFNGHLLLEKFPEMAEVLDKYRINPGNVGFGENHEYNFEKVIKIAIQNKKTVRIGVNWGSLDHRLFTLMMEQNAKRIRPLSSREVTVEAMVESAMRSAQLAEKIGLPKNRIVLSVKMSQVPDVISAYEKLAYKMKENNSLYALHLGLTEAGSGIMGHSASVAALSVLLQKGIGDTIRVSTTPQPGQPRTAEVQIAKSILQSLELRHFEPKITSCPGCGRTDSTFFQELADDVNEHIQQNLPRWIAKNPQVTELKIAVMGCIVNGPGESRHADIAISLPGKNEEPCAPLFIRGKYFKTLTGKDISHQFITILDDFLENGY